MQASYAPAAHRGYGYGSLTCSGWVEAPEYTIVFGISKEAAGPGIIDPSRIPLLSPDGSRPSCYDGGKDEDAINDLECLYSPRAWRIVDIVYQHNGCGWRYGWVGGRGESRGWRGLREPMMLLIWGEEERVWRGWGLCQLYRTWG